MNARAAWRLDRTVRKHGWAPARVGRYGEHVPSWVHSVGFQETLGQPEVILFDTPHPQGVTILWQAFEALKAGVLTLADGFTLRLEDADYDFVWRKVHPSQFASGHRWFNLATAPRPSNRDPSGELSAFQLVLCDQQGKLPWDAGYDETARARQPALWLPAIDRAFTSSMERDAFRLVAERGWTTVEIEGPLSWAYSIGFPGSVSSPEVICFVNPPRAAPRILADVREHLADGRLKLEDGLVWDGLGFPGCWRRVEFTQVMGFNWMLLAKEHAEWKAGRRVDIEAFQYILADKNGRYPWDEDCHPYIRDSQPLLFMRLDPDNHPPRAL
jgi:hypothetical protein